MAVVIGLLMITSIVWPAVFVISLLDAIKKTLKEEPCQKETLWAIISLTLMTISPFVIAMTR